MGGDLTQQGSSQTGMTDLINATKGQALNTGALVQSSQNLVTSTNDQVTQATNLVTQTTNLVTQATNQVTQLTALVTAVTNLTTSINNALSLGPWSTWSPTVTSGTGTITTVGTVVARYITAGKTVYFSLSATITTNGTGASYVAVTMPVSNNSNVQSICVGRESGVSNKALTGYLGPSSNSMHFAFYDNTYPGANGAIISASGVYESA